MTHDIHQQTIVAQFTKQGGAYTMQRSDIQVNVYVPDVV